VPKSERLLQNTCWIALGGNLGHVATTFDAALSRLQQVPGVQVVRSSRRYDTAPVGRAAGWRFLNAAAELQTALTPLALLDHLQEIEADLGRTRNARWGARTIDLDLLLWGEEIIDTPRLTVPHPALWQRRFVLDPLAEIAPEAWHPVFCLKVADLRGRLLARPFPLAIIGLEPAATELFHHLDRHACGQIQRVVDVAAAAIVLLLPSAPLVSSLVWTIPSVVRLEDSADPVPEAVDLLTAALDEPRVVAG
jgi:2-amino-4-hydroxy-6-hydroxymethyldihydropteridine diphosphokinase